MIGTERVGMGLLAALALACSGAGACVFLAPFPEVAADPAEGGEGGHGGGGGGGSSPEEGCLPGERVACYSGPRGTQGVGVCKAGFARCGERGEALGVCFGEVLPTFEDCTTDEDENCDGRGCTGEYAGGILVRGTGEQRGQAVAVGQGAIVLVGEASGSTDLGAGLADELGGPGQGDSFVVSFSPDKQVLFSRRFADSVARGVAIAPDGDVLIAGVATGDVDFGGGPLSGKGKGEDVVIARLDASGAHRFSRRFGNGATQYATAVAVDAIGNAVITGRFWGRLDFGAPDPGSNGYGSSGALVSSGESDAFVAKLDAHGEVLWAKQIGDEGYHHAGTGVAVDRQGNVIVAGWFTGNADYRDDWTIGQARTDMFIAKLDAGGNILWVTTAESSNAAWANGVAVDGAGNVFVAAAFRSRVTFENYVEHTNKGDKDALLFKLDDNGRLRWSTSFGDNHDQEALAVAVDQAGNVVVTGSFYGAVDLGQRPLIAAGAEGFLAKLDPDGSPIWSRAFGGPGDQSGTALAIDHLGAAWMTGYFSEGIDFGDGVVSSRGASDAFLVHLGP